MEKFVKVLDYSHVRNVFIVPDIHGRFDLLREKLAELKFDPEKDRCVAVGDLIDRGKYSHRCLEFLRQHESVLGNHELQAILGVFDSYQARLHKQWGGQWLYKLPEDDQAVYAREFMKLPIAIEILHQGKKYGVVHADVWGNDWEIFKQELIKHKSSDIYHGDAPYHGCSSRRRIRSWFTSHDHENHKPIANVDQVYVGHCIFPEPISHHNINYIDTGAFATNELTVVKAGDTFEQAECNHLIYSQNSFWE